METANLTFNIEANTARAAQGIAQIGTRLSQMGRSANQAARNTLGMNTSMARVTQRMNRLGTTVLKYVGALYILRQAKRNVTRAFTESFNAVEKYNVSVGQNAALMASFMKYNPGEDLAQGYKRAQTYAEAMRQRMVGINHLTIANVHQMDAINQELIKGGVLVDLNNKKHEEGFIALVNAAATVSAHHADSLRKMSQEVRSMMQGRARDGSALALMLRARFGEAWKEIIRDWIEADTLLENMFEVFKGFNAEGSVLVNTWKLIGNALRTTVDEMILRPGFEETYNVIITKAHEINEYLKEHADIIANRIHKFWVKTADIITTIDYVNLGKVALELIKISVAFKLITMATGLAIKLTKITVALGALVLLNPKLVLLAAALTAVGYGLHKYFTRDTDAQIANHERRIDTLNKSIERHTKILNNPVLKGGWIPFIGGDMSRWEIQASGKEINELNEKIRELRKQQEMGMEPSNFYTDMLKYVEEAQNRISGLASTTLENAKEIKDILDKDVADLSKEGVKDAPEVILDSALNEDAIDKKYAKLLSWQDQVRQKEYELAEMLNNFWMDTFSVIENGLSNMFMLLGDKTMTFGEKLESVWLNMRDTFFKMVSDMIARWLVLMVLTGGNMAIANQAISTTFSAPQFHTGTDNVPKDMHAYLQKGEAVIPTKTNEFLKSNQITISGPGGPKNDDIVEALSIVSNKLEDLKELEKDVYVQFGDATLRPMLTELRKAEKRIGEMG